MRFPLGRGLMTVGALATTVVPYAADWNETHNFSPGFSPHARLHATESIFTSTAMGALAGWLLWRGTPATRPLRMGVAAVIPTVHWGTYNLAVLVPTTSIDEDDGPVPRVLGVPANLLIQNVFAVLTAAGYLLDRHDQARNPWRS